MGSARIGPVISAGAVVALCIASLAWGKDPKPAPTVQPDDVVFSNTQKRPHGEVETTSAVLPAAGKLPGLAFVESGQTLLARRMEPDGKIGPLEAVELPPLGPGESLLAIDNMLVRLKSGELLLIRQSQTTADVTAPPAAAKAFAEWRDYTKGNRAFQAVWRSSERGRKWTRLPNLDCALVLDGVCGWPQQVNGKPWVGGWDRPEAYVDTWNGTVFLTMGCTSGTAPLFKSHYFEHEMLFVSRDEGETWTPSFQMPRWEPVTMTTTDDGRLFLCHLLGVDAVSCRAHLYWLDPPWTQVAGEADVYYGDPSKPENRARQLLADELDPRVGQPNVVPAPLSRVRRDGGSHVIRVSFPAVAGGRQVQRVVVVRIDAKGHVETTPGPTFEAADPKGSVLQATFVESDRAEMKEDDDCALMYWMETAPATGEMVARGAVVRGATDWSAPFDLSVAAGKRRAWKPHGEWLGDYMKGAFFFDGAAPCFLAQWPESSPPNIDLHANVVSLPR
jgi:hypothetical protein